MRDDALDSVRGPLECAEMCLNTVPRVDKGMAMSVGSS